MMIGKGTLISKENLEANLGILYDSAHCTKNDGNGVSNNSNDFYLA